MNMTSPRRTPLYDRHVALGGRMVDFAGWEMPVQYKGIIAEHLACRAAAAIFDVSHMGEVKIRGRDALASVQRIATNDASKLVDGRVQYAAMCRPTGGVVDDITVYRRGPEDYCFVVNASNADKDVAWIREHATGDTRVEDVSAVTALIAVQGPRAPAIVQSVADREILDLPRYWFREGAVKTPAGTIAATFSRTGYTGEDGFEVACPWERAGEVWDRLMEAGSADGIVPAGLGARDTLRLEAKMCLYGHELSEETTPLEAGIGWAVALDSPAKGDFIGREALRRQKAEGLSRRLVGFEVTGAGIARQGYPILVGGKPAGVVTSGTKSPTLGKPIGLGYVPAGSAKPGTLIEIEIRGKAVAAVIVPTPFYKPARPA
jgi:aminomethyltransferase